MNLQLVRKWLTPESTCGELFIDWVWECFTLELPIKDGLPGSAIPEGTYQVICRWSPKFGRNMPLLIDVPNRSNIEIHWGNTAADTDGCLLLGQTHNDKDFIGGSRAAFDAFWPKFMDRLHSKYVSITVMQSEAPYPPSGESSVLPVLDANDL